MKEQGNVYGQVEAVEFLPDGEECSKCGSMIFLKGYKIRIVFKTGGFSDWKEPVYCQSCLDIQ